MEVVGLKRSMYIVQLIRLLLAYRKSCHEADLLLLALGECRGI